MRSWGIAGILLVGLTMPSAAHDLDAKFLIDRKGEVIGYRGTTMAPAVLTRTALN